MTLRNFQHVKQGGNFAGLSLVIFFLAIFSTGTFAQIWIDEEEVGPRYTNESEVTNAAVNGGGYLRNQSDGSITNATVHDGFLDNFSGMITNVTVSGSESDPPGALNNHSSITNATVNTGGLLQNLGTINHSTVDGGKLNNYAASTITSVTMKDGTLNNDGRIHEMTYLGGEYNGIFGSGTGAIDNIIIADQLNVSNHWGTIELLQFANNDSGALVFTGYLPDENTSIVGLIPNILFHGINAQIVDLAYGGIILDLSNVGTFKKDWNSFLVSVLGETFSLQSLFEIAEITGTKSLNYIDIHWQNESFRFLDKGDLAKGWNYSNSEVEFIYGEAMVPEPTTLLMFGLGLAGVGLAGRRKMKN